MVCQNSKAFASAHSDASFRFLVLADRRNPGTNAQSAFLVTAAAIHYKTSTEEERKFMPNTADALLIQRRLAPSVSVATPFRLAD
jgi:hypothetical protein